MHPRLLPFALGSLLCAGAGSALVASGLAGCAEASGEVQGGEPLYDGGSTSTATMDLPDVGAVTWTDLYTDYFGPTGPASCTAVAAGCHLSAVDLGAKSSGYVCGASKESCWAGITSSASTAYPPPVPDGGSSSPETTVLYENLRQAGSAAGTMPLSSADGGMGYTFTALDLARIAAWIQQGAAND
jgi:hypothetical protein